MDAFVKFFSLHRPFEAYFYEICFGRRPLREERWTRLATWWLPAIRPTPLQIRMNARKKKSLLTSDGCWSLKCCLFSPLHLSFIPSGISERIDLEMMSLTFLIWSGPNSATKRIRSMQAVSNLPYSAAICRVSPLRFKTKPSAYVINYSVSRLYKNKAKIVDYALFTRWNIVGKVPSVSTNQHLAILSFMF